MRRGNAGVTAWQLVVLALTASSCAGCKSSQGTGKAVHSDSGTKKAAPLQVDYSVQGGPELGSGIHEVEQHLRVDFGEKVVHAERRQPSSDEGGESVGSFRAPLPAALGERLRTELAKVELSKVGPGTVGGPGASLIRIRSSEGAQVEEASLSSRDIPLLEGIEPLVEALDDLTQHAVQHPHEALSLNLTQKTAGAGGTVFTLVVKNVGTQPVVLPDPRSLPSASPERPLHAAGVRLAAYPKTPPGVTAPPLEWAYVGIAERSTTTRPVPLVLAPGQEASFDAEPWRTPDGQVRHLVQGVLSMYQPAPSDGGAVPVLGRLLSEALVVEP